MDMGPGKRPKRVVVDPGHGGFDPGAEAPGPDEKDLALRIAETACLNLVRRGADVLMTRSRDNFIPLRQRLQMALDYQADAMVSVHCNSSADPNAHGWEIFYRDERDKPLADNLAHRLTCLPDISRRGVFQDVERLGKHLAVLNDLQLPAALVEAGFLSNPADREAVNREADSIGELIACATADFLGLIKAEV